MLLRYNEEKKKKFRRENFTPSVSINKIDDDPEPESSGPSSSLAAPSTGISIEIGPPPNTIKANDERPLNLVMDKAEDTMESMDSGDVEASELQNDGDTADNEKNRELDEE